MLFLVGALLDNGPRLRVAGRVLTRQAQGGTIVQERLRVPRRRILLGCAAVVASVPTGWTGRVFADEAIPAQLQAEILIRVLGYDRQLKSRAGDAVRVGVLFKQGDAASEQAQDEIIRALRGFASRTVQGLPLVVSAQPFKDSAELTAWITRERLAVVYAGPGLAASTAGIKAACVEKRVACVSPVRALVEKGLAFGVVLKRDRPGILVNLPAAEAMGLDLDPKLLELAEVIR